MLIVHSMDRLARNVEDMLRLVREMNDRGVSVEFIKENMSFTAGSNDPRSILMFTMLSTFAQFERSLIKERQREGIALAKAKGTVYKGRKPALNAERITQLREQATAGANRTKLAKEFGISHKLGNSLSIY
jgi:DNA invertase Pin-like site-specific DNA recombinase